MTGGGEAPDEADPPAAPGARGRALRAFAAPLRSEDAAFRFLLAVLALAVVVVAAALLIRAVT